jgi:hypothetical protein
MRPACYGALVFSYAEAAMAKIAKGELIHGPNGMAYEMSRDLNTGDEIMADLFIPVGGAPEPQPHLIMPDWLANALQELAESRRER